MIAAVVLAAGSSTRMGRPKLLLPLSGKSLIRRAVEEARASKADHVVVVTGGHAEAVERELVDLPVRIVRNPDHAAGMSTSLRAGLTALQSETEAAIVLLADQPLVDRQVIDELIDVYRRESSAIVQARYAGQAGNPVLWDRRLFAELTAQTGDRGGREILRRRADEVDWCDFPEARLNVDVDTPSDYEALQGVLESPDRVENGGPGAHEHHEHQHGGARFCPGCGGSLCEQLVEDRARPVCTACGAVFWHDPKVAVATLIPWRDGVLLGRRAIEPGMGRWSFPSGYVDRGEDVEEAARREVLEETGLEVRIVGLVGVYSKRGRPVILIAYAGEVAGGEPAPGPEVTEVAGFPVDGLPEMAFEHDDRIVADWLALRRRVELPR